MWPMLGSVPTFTVLYLLGIAVHAGMVVYFCRRRAVRYGWSVIIALSYAVSMTAGARVLFDATQAQWPGMTEVLTPAYYVRGGLWGGPLLHLAIVTGLALVAARRRADVLDSAALALPVPMALAKVGCLLNGCCHGSATTWPWGVRFGVNPGGAPVGIALHPVQFYEVVVLGIAFALMLSMRGRRWRGLRLPVFLVVYGVGRGLLEFVRGDSGARAMAGPLTISQWLVFAGAGGALVMLAWAARRRRAPDRTPAAMV